MKFLVWTLPFYSFLVSASGDLQPGRYIFSISGANLHEKPQIVDITKIDELVSVSLNLGGNTVASELVVLPQISNTNTRPFSATFQSQKNGYPVMLYLWGNIVVDEDPKVISGGVVLAQPESSRGIEVEIGTFFLRRIDE